MQELIKTIREVEFNLADFPINPQAKNYDLIKAKTLWNTSPSFLSEDLKAQAQKILFLAFDKGEIKMLLTPLTYRIALMVKKKTNCDLMPVLQQWQYEIALKLKKIMLTLAEKHIQAPQALWLSQVITQQHLAESAQTTDKNAILNILMIFKALIIVKNKLFIADLDAFIQHLFPKPVFDHYKEIELYKGNAIYTEGEPNRFHQNGVMASAFYFPSAPKLNPFSLSFSAILTILGIMFPLSHYENNCVKKYTEILGDGKDQDIKVSEFVFMQTTAERILQQIGQDEKNCDIERQLLMLETTLLSPSQNFALVQLGFTAQLASASWLPALRVLKLRELTKQENLEIGHIYYALSFDLNLSAMADIIRYYSFLHTIYSLAQNGKIEPALSTFSGKMLFGKVSGTELSTTDANVAIEIIHGLKKSGLFRSFAPVELTLQYTFHSNSR